MIIKANSSDVLRMMEDSYSQRQNDIDSRIKALQRGEYYNAEPFGSKVMFLLKTTFVDYYL